MRSLAAYPAAEVVGIRTDGLQVTQVSVRCPYCSGGIHTHPWFGEPDGLRTASCSPYDAVYRVVVGVREKIDAMKAEYPADEGVIGLVPLALQFAYEMDGPDEDVIGVVISASLGRFVLWLPLPTAIGVANAIVDIAEGREELRLQYLEAQKTAPSVAPRATNEVGVV